MTKQAAIILIHGFGQTPATWQKIVQSLAGPRAMLAPQLRGHGLVGLSRGAADYESVRGDLCALIDGGLVERAVLWGYSQGVRVALDFALNHPEIVAGLILESGTAGIEDGERRAARRVHDEELAEWIEQHTPEEFAEYWSGQPLFANQTPELTDALLRDRTRHDPAALADALRGLGQGTFVPVWDRLDEITAPALVLTGELDPEYIEIGRAMAERLPNASHIAVHDAGHAVHLEQPELTVFTVGEFLGTIEE